MKRLCTLILVAAVSTPAFAAGKCNYGSPDVFEFVRWKFTKVDGDWMEMEITYRNKLDKALTEYEIRIEVEDIGFAFRSKELIKAGGEATAKNQNDMPQEDADRFQPLTPVLCAIGADDETGKHTTY